MALTVKQLIDQALLELQDEQSVRWSRAEMLDYFNAAQRALAEHRPDQMLAERDVVLKAGWQQQLDDDVLALMDVTHNVNQAQKRITKTNLWVLDAVAPAWRSTAAAREVVHFMLDLRAAKEFLVYPPVQAGVKVRAKVALMPEDLAKEDQPPSVPVRWMDSLRHFVLARAWSKDAEFGGNAALATANYQLFFNALGVQSSASAAMAPADS